MTGRGAGYCAGNPAPGYANRPFGFGGGPGFRGGRWGGHGWRRRYYATGLPFWAWRGEGPLTAKDQLAALQEHAEWLKERLEAVRRRIEELESETEKKD
jgi:hypothetical protein